MSNVDKVKKKAAKSYNIWRPKHSIWMEDSSKNTPKIKRKSKEEDWSPQKKKPSKEKSEDEEKENKTDVKTKRSKRSNASFQKYF